MRTLGEIVVLGLSSGAIYALLAIGLVLVYQTTRVLNFAQAEAGTFAMYLSWWLHDTTGLPGWATAVFGIAALIVVGLVFERFVVRPMLDGPRLSLTVATLGLMSIMGFLPIVFWRVSPRFPPDLVDGSITVAGVVISAVQVLALAAAAMLAIALWLLLRRTTLGLGMLAAAEDPSTLRLMGVRLSRISAFTWTSAFALGALAGILTISAIPQFQPFTMTTWFVRGLAAALLGGLTSLPGAVIGGVSVGLIEAAIRQADTLPFVDRTPPGLAEFVLMLLVLAVLVLRPRGMMGKEAAA
ncbi:MAG: branched-chain amino acid ABC transporter permease [Actinobacteria bacterium]|nr:branched-chain amino acid ABC transporter permease [Actinomycetota bacterium]